MECIYLRERFLKLAVKVKILISEVSRFDKWDFHILLAAFPAVSCRETQGIYLAAGRTFKV